MPVHNVMYTYGKAEELRKKLQMVDGEEASAIVGDCAQVASLAVQVASKETEVVLDFFQVLLKGMNSSNPQVRELCSKIYHSSYNAEIA